jgi:CheY-like chemotaxis protein
MNESQQKAINDLVHYVLTDWRMETMAGFEACKFCLCYQGNVTYETHSKDCPRIEWATVNKDLPKDRVEKAVGREFKNWTLQLQVTTDISVLTEQGQIVKELLNCLRT